VIAPNSVIIQFGNERGTGKLIYSMKYDRLKELSDPDLRLLQNLLREVFQRVVSEDGFRRIKEAEPITELLK
jgi:hypothetical protein